MDPGVALARGSLNASAPWAHYHPCPPARYRVGGQADMPYRYRWHTGAVLLLIGWWGFGNLYEAMVVMPWLMRLPPGSVIGEFAPGSPVFYFLPAGITLLVLAWALVVRIARERADRTFPGAMRAVLTAAVLVTLAAAATGVLVTVVNPVFPDPTATHADVRTAVLLWESGNAVRLVLATAAATSLIRWRVRLTRY